MAKLIKKYFTKSSIWVCPPSITGILLVGSGGGGGGGPGNSFGGGGGGGAIQNHIYVTVVPGSKYTITIGAGGTSGVAGGDTIFSLNGTTLAIFYGASTDDGNGDGGAAFKSAAGTGAATNLFTISNPGSTVSNSTALMGGGGGSGNGNGSVGTVNGSVGSLNVVSNGATAGAAGTLSGSNSGGGGGGAGTLANGGKGGNGGANGTTATANIGSGAGGGGGGTGGTGGSGGSGYLNIVYCT